MRLHTLLAIAVAAAATRAPAHAQTLTPPDTACAWRPECSASGATLTMAELSRTGSGRDARVTVAPRVAGFPVGVPLTFWMRKLDGRPQWLATGYTLEPSGNVVCADRGAHAAVADAAGTGWCPTPLDSIDMTLGGSMEGEPFDFAFSTVDGRTSAFASVVPRPAAAGVAGCGTLEARLIDADGRAVSILGSGFAPNVELTTESVRGKERLPGSVRTNDAGRFVGVVTFQGRGGDASYTVRTASCEITLPYHWGRAAR